MTMQHWANRYLGKPWEKAAEGPHAYDCYGLVRAIYRDFLQIDLPLFDIAAMSPVAIRRDMHTEAGSGRWQPLDFDTEPLRDFDVLLMSYAKRAHHVGIWVEVDGGRVLHALEGAGVVAPSWHSLPMSGWRVIEAYRRKL